MDVCGNKTTGAREFLNIIRVATGQSELSQSVQAPYGVCEPCIVSAVKSLADYYDTNHFVIEGPTSFQFDQVENFVVTPGKSRDGAVGCSGS